MGFCSEYHFVATLGHPVSYPGSAQDFQYRFSELRALPYDYVVYDSDVERRFAKRLDERTDIRLLLKLPGGFEIDTLAGKYNPDWAVVKHEDETLYLVREINRTKDFLELRTTEADKVRCGAGHFKAIDVPFAVFVSADEV